MTLADLIGLVVSLLLTLMVFSYLLGDNPVSRPMYRIALHIFIGAAAAYALVVAWANVLGPRLVEPLAQIAASGAPADVVPVVLQVLIPLLLSLFLLFKLLRSSMSQVGNVSVAFLVGVGAAVAVGGAVTGTIFAQVRAGAAASALPLGDLLSLQANALERLVEAGVFFVGTLTALMYFFFTARRTPGGAERPLPLAGLAVVGQVFINIAYAALFAGALAASLALLTDRFAFLREAIGKFGG